MCELTALQVLMEMEWLQKVASSSCPDLAKCPNMCPGSDNFDDFHQILAAVQTNKCLSRFQISEHYSISECSARDLKRFPYILPVASEFDRGLDLVHAVLGERLLVLVEVEDLILEALGQDMYVGAGGVSCNA